MSAPSTADAPAPGVPAGRAGRVRQRSLGTVEDVSTAVPPTVPPTDATPDAPPAGPEPVGFQVRLPAFTGPFDLLLQLIGKQKLEITELSLSKVTDEFIAYIRNMGDSWDLDEASEFLVVAATLLDLKTAKLLPQAEVEDEEDLALLEARDLLFARLLQYKAFKELAAVIAARDAEFSRGYPRAVKMEERYSEALPDLVLGIGPDRLAELAVRALLPKTPPVVAISHVHMVRISVREHADILQQRLLRLHTATFRGLCADCQSVLEIVARFLALLELYREGLVTFDQMTALGELTVQWTGDGGAVELNVDEFEGSPPPPEVVTPAPIGEAELVEYLHQSGDDERSADDLVESEPEGTNE